MTIPSLLRNCMVLVLCLLLALPALPQSGGSIGPSKGEIVGIIAGVAAGLAVVGVLVYRESHRRSSITGCVVNGADGLTMQNERDKKVYALPPGAVELKAGERVTIRGKKRKDSNGKLSLQVETLTKDFGSCAP